MEKVYGNEYLLATLGSMAVRDRAAHSMLFYGEKGCGKKLLAKYYTSLIMCEAPSDGKPCGKCRACLNVDNGTHPDVMRVKTSGKLGGYSVETAREVISDAYIRPNNSSGKKVYIFADCRDPDPRMQNTLLKLIEEPPDYAYFIFTAGSRSSFLPTIISRCVCFGVSECSEDEARAALKGYGYSESDTERAVSCFHGNIGKCISYIDDENVRRRVDLTKALTDSIIRRDEYELNSAVYSVSRERNDVREVLYMLDLLVRDCAVLSKDSGAPALGCCREEALKLSEQITVYQAARLHVNIEKAWSALNSNAGIPLVLAALCADIISTVS